MRKIFVILALCTSTLVLIGQNLNQDLLLHYEFAGNALDDSGNGFHAVPFNVSNGEDRFGVLNESFHFNGVNTYIETPASSVLRPTFPFSIAYWFNPNASIAASCNIFSPDYEIGRYAGPIAGYSGVTNKINFSYGDGGVVRPQDRRSWICEDLISTGEWNLVVGVFESSTNVVIYINGCLCSQLITSGSGGAMVYLNNGGRLNTHHFSGLNSFSGEIDDLYFRSRALTELDVEMLHDYHPGVPEFNLGNDTILCDGNMIELVLPSNFSDVQWSTGESGNIISVGTAGQIWAVGEDLDCGVHRDTIIIDFFNPAQSVFNVDLCDGDTVIVAGGTYTSPGSFTAVLPNASADGCDSTIFIEITLVNPSIFFLDTFICEGTGLI